VFLDKDGPYFSEETQSRNACEWIRKIWYFSEFRNKILGGNTKLFFVWLKNYTGKSWNFFSRWYDLKVGTKRADDLLDEFQKYLSNIATKVMVAQTFFLKTYPMPFMQGWINPDILRQRHIWWRIFLTDVYGHSASFSRRRFQVAMIGKLSMRLIQSESLNQKNLSYLRIFSRMMLRINNK